MSIIAFLELKSGRCGIILTVKEGSLLMRAVEFLSIGRVFPDPEWHLRSQVHPYHELIVPQSGEMTIETADGSTLFLRKGEYAIYPAGASHAERSDRLNPVSTIFICFQAELPIRHIQIFQDPDGLAAQLANQLFSHRFSRENSWHDACLKLLLEEVEHLFVPRSEEAEWLAGVHRYMQTHLEKKITLDELAKCACMSRYYFIHRYKALVGMTPMAYLRQLRCDAAGKLLMYSSIPIKEIARQTGFPDPFALSKCLRKHYGLPPRMIRENSLSQMRSATAENALPRRKMS